MDAAERCRQKVDCGNSILFNQKSISENLLSKKFKAQKVEAGLKVMVYNRFMSL
jgi:hypothetical protein